MSWIMGAAAVAIGIGWKIAWAQNIPPQIPLFYSKPWGDEQLAEPSWIWAPIVMTVMAAGIILIANKKLTKYPVLQTTTSIAALISQIILVTAIIRIIVLIM